MNHIMPKAVALALACALTLPLAACGGDKTNQPSPDTTPVAAATPEPTPTPAADPYDAVRTYWSADQLTQAWGPDQAVEHLFFHPVIAYPEYAFSDAVPYDRQVGLDEWMVTADEYKKILQSVYDKGYILVNMGDVWSEVTGEDGVTRMERNTLMLPEGKKPLIISFDDVNYYDYMLAEGFTSKLVLGDDGQIWAQCTDPNTGETFLTQDLDATPILDQFVLEHPDFSLNGAKAIFSLTGYQGILGYRTQNDIDIAADDPRRPAFDANRQAEIEAVKPVIERLKETGWTFGSHTWGHIRLGTKSLESIGLSVGSTESAYNNDYEEGEVCFQSVAKDTMVEKGTKVNLIISLGPDPNSIPVPDEVTKTVTFNLPDTGAVVNVSVVDQDGNSVWDHQYDTSLQLAFEVDLKGNGQETFTLYVDGNKYSSQVVDFES